MLAPAVLMVVANQDFYWDEYAKPRAELERAGIHVVVAAAAKGTCRPHSSSGGHPIQAELAVERAEAKDYQAILFVGGWGAASYQFASRERYLNPTYNGRPAMRAAVNGLIGDFLRQGGGWIRQSVEQPTPEAREHYRELVAWSLPQLRRGAALL